MTAHRNFLVSAAFWVLWSAAGGLQAQDRLSLQQAVETVVTATPEIVAARAAAHESEQRVPQARAGYFPRIDFTQTWQRGNQPVFVFGSLLAQRQFADIDFALRQLNHPEPLTNSRTAFSLEQVLFDGGRTRAAVRAASLAADTAKAAERQVRSELALAATRAYGQVLRAAAEKHAAESAVAAAEEDARTAEARRDAGTGTEADLLSMRVHLAQMRARAIDASGNERIARADLNRLMNAPLDRAWVLDEPAVVETALPNVSSLVEQALRLRPEIQQAALRRDLSRVQRQAAAGALLPQAVVQGGYEWNDGRRGSPAAAWMAGASVRVSLFDGGATIARLREASFAMERAQAEQDRAEAAVRIDVWTATEHLAAARGREAVGRAAVMQARESQRMIRDRYEAGMAPAGDVIRAATAALDAEAQRIGALVDVIVGTAALRRAAGSEEAHP